MELIQEAGHAPALTQTGVQSFMFAKSDSTAPEQSMECSLEQNKVLLRQGDDMQ